MSTTIKAKGYDTVGEEKKADSLSFGPQKVVLSSDKEAMKAAEKSIDFLLITVPNPFDLTPYISTMGLNGSIVTVGLLGEYKKPLTT